MYVINLTNKNFPTFVDVFRVEYIKFYKSFSELIFTVNIIGDI